ncbi:MAG TPA: hypothetical protein VES79_06785 [Solirubrobacteraceae bacterium]|nr:hypothetical protein [Solirubrobacteraceae bacterium]
MRAVTYRRFRAESGHTLMELVVAMSLGMGILLIAFALLDRSLGLSNEVGDRVDAVQRGRLAMDTITRQLRSQVCLGAVPALVTAQADTVTFYSNLSDGSRPPEKHTLTFDSATGTLEQTALVGTGFPPATSFLGTPRRNVLLNRAARNGASPVFSYYGFDTASPPKAVAPLTAPLSALDRERTARIEISFVSRPTRATTTNNRAAVLTDEIFVRSADPNDPAPVPKCA